jgi:multicomponent Na+:H+ antiporter subunit E
MRQGLLRSAVVRGAGFIALWAILIGTNPADLAAGVFAAAAASWASLHLLPTGTGRLRPGACSRLALRFLRQSVIAGVDVARRALDPRLPLRPGFIVFPAILRPGPGRSMFTTLMSMLPGTVPAGSDAGGGILFHCLDIGQPVVVQLRTEEALFARASGGVSADG